MIYSIVVSCQRFGHEPHAYLEDVFTRLLIGPAVSRPPCL